MVSKIDGSQNDSVKMSLKNGLGFVGFQNPAKTWGFGFGSKNPEKNQPNADPWCSQNVSSNLNFASRTIQAILEENFYSLDTKELLFRLWVNSGILKPEIIHRTTLKTIS